MKNKEIKRGDTWECLKCHKPILLNADTFKLSWDGEYILCPHCNWGYDVIAYHKYGKKSEREGSGDVCD